MDASLLEMTGVALLLISAAGATTALYGQAKRGAGRIALALTWLVMGALGTTALLSGLVSGSPSVVVIGTAVAGCLLVCAVVLAILRGRERSAARRRDAELGHPPLPSSPATWMIVSAAGLVSLLLCAVVIAPWMLVAAASAGIGAGQILPGLFANLAVATPIVWIAVTALVSARFRRAAADAELLRRGIEARVIDAEVLGYRSGFASGREEGYRHAAFGTTWE